MPPIIRLLQAIRNLTKSGVIKNVEQAYQLAKRELRERFNEYKKNIDDAYNQGKKEQTLDKRTKDIKKIDEEGIKSLDVKDAGTDKDFIDFVREQGDEAGANKLQKEVDRLNKIIEDADTTGTFDKEREQLQDALTKLTKEKSLGTMSQEAMIQVSC
jgi:hypothetical protein